MLCRLKARLLGSGDYLADELDTLSVRCLDLGICFERDRHLASNSADEVAIDLERLIEQTTVVDEQLLRQLDSVACRAWGLAASVDDAEYEDCDVDLERIVNLALTLDGLAEVVRYLPAVPEAMLATARLLPEGVRRRFVGELMGDLGTCESRWERLRYLTGVTIGFPRLAWMMHRENRRGRA
jgi:hypothetical protein